MLGAYSNKYGTLDRPHDKFEENLDGFLLESEL